MSYDFEVPFQRRLLAALWSDGKFLKTHPDVVRPEWFTDERHQALARVLSGREGPLAELPETLEALKAQVPPGRTWGEFAEEARKVWKLRKKDPARYLQAAQDFARHQAVAQAIGESAELLRLGEYDQLEAQLRRALRTGVEQGSQTVDILSDEQIVHRSSNPGDVDGLGGRVSSGFGPLDEATRSGLAPGEVGCVLGIAGGGKSTVLRQIAANALLAGRNVLHVSCENSLEITASMYDSLLTGMTSGRIRKRPKRFLKLMRKLRDSMTSRLRLVFFPQRTMTLGQFESIIESQDPHPDLVVLDYAELAKPPQKRDDKRFEIADTWEGVRRISSQARVPVWSAHQGNRPGMGVRLLGMEHLGECFAIAGIVDVGISVNSDEDRRAEAVLNVWKNRLGPQDFTIPCEADWKLSRIRAVSDEV